MTRFKLATLFGVYHLGHFQNAKFKRHHFNGCNCSGYWVKWHQIFFQVRFHTCAKCIPVNHVLFYYFNYLFLYTSIISYPAWMLDVKIIGMQQADICLFVKNLSLTRGRQIKISHFQIGCGRWKWPLIIEPEIDFSTSVSQIIVHYKCICILVQDGVLSYFCILVVII